MFLYIQVVEETSFNESPEQYTNLVGSATTDKDKAALVQCIPEINYEYYSSRVMDRASIDELGLDGPEDEFNDGVYGVPGSLLRLIARTTSLINEIQPHLCGTLPTELDQKASILENNICAWNTRSGIHNGEMLTSVANLSPGQREKSGQDVSDIMQTCISAAVSHALLLYFFRSVRNTNPVILQHYVESIIRNMETHTEYKIRFSSTRVNIVVWPTFIAACDAIGEDLRLRSIECLRQAAWSGFRNWEAAEGVAREVWRRRDAGYVNATWQSVLRESSVNMILT
jgi:arginine metabolism regulation protein II